MAVESATALDAEFRRQAARRGAVAFGSVTCWPGTTYVAASQTGICAVHLPGWDDKTQPLGVDGYTVSVDSVGDERAGHYLTLALRQLGEYFTGTRTSFDVPLDLRGPEFFRRTWLAVAAVPYGETRSYGEIACALRAASATRAVGAANGANPVAPLVPCHRIVGSNGRLTGYGPGLPLKQRLLVMEHALPQTAGHVDAWRESVARGLGVDEIIVGVRRTRLYCSATCGRWRVDAMLPQRVFARTEDALAAGFSPCPVCFPTQPSLFDIAGL